MHSLNIAHRDLKLENILLSEDFKIKLCDFGLSTVYIKDKHIDGPVGSAIYKSPENTAFKQYDAEKNDVFALGVILFFLVLGSAPVYSRVHADDFYYKYFVN